jgi:hypothetical protein
VRSREEAGNPEALISRARLQEEIWTEGTPPMMMQAELQFSDDPPPLRHSFNTFVFCILQFLASIPMQRCRKDAVT